MENSTRLRAGGGEAPPYTRAFGRKYIQKGGLRRSLVTGVRIDQKQKIRLRSEIY